MDRQRPRASESKRAHHAQHQMVVWRESMATSMAQQRRAAIVTAKFLLKCSSSRCSRGCLVVRQGGLPPPSPKETPSLNRASQRDQMRTFSRESKTSTFCTGVICRAEKKARGWWRTHSHDTNDIRGPSMRPWSMVYEKGDTRLQISSSANHRTSPFS